LARTPQSEVVARIVVRHEVRRGQRMVDVGVRDKDVGLAFSRGALTLPARGQGRTQFAEAAAAVEDEESIGRLDLDASRIASVGRAQMERQMLLDNAADVGFEVRSGSQTGEAVLLQQQAN